MNQNPLLDLEALGQSVWIDFIRRGTITSGQLQRWINDDGVSGVTSNPSIFEKAIAGSHDYDETVRAMALEGKSPEAMYEGLTVADIRHAAALFLPIYQQTAGMDGFVSIEVSPALVHDTKGTIEQAERLWGLVNSQNVMIKVPGTKEGLPAIRHLIGEGINVNITLLFGLPRYRDVVEAYLSGLEDLQAKGKPLGKVSSVASFFLSRIDTLIDPTLAQIAKTGGPKAGLAKSLQGQAAIASAKVAYQIFQDIFFDARFQRLQEQGAHPQRLLWASTSTKNPAYSDVKYVEALIGPDTVNTMPVETLDAYRDHGRPERQLDVDVEQAHKALDGLAELGINIDLLTQQLENEGAEKFSNSFDELMKTLTERRTTALREPTDIQDFELGGFAQPVQERIAAMQNDHFGDRLWRKDASLWKQDPRQQEDIRGALGWLRVADKMEENLQELSDFVKSVKEAGFRHVLHMGMGGSSLAPLVFTRTFRPTEKGLPVTVLDTTDPRTILDLAWKLPIADTLFIVASKSGTTAEPEAFCAYFYEQVKAIKGERAGENFIAITDPGTPLVKEAEELGFRKVFLNFADIGGRYSALSYFGLLPAALMGLEVGELLVRALRMEHACDACVRPEENPGLRLGAALGELALHQHDKVTFLMPEKVEGLGLWLEQLLAESTGKEGKGLLPVANEPPGEPVDYSEDRLFIYTRLKGAEDPGMEREVEALRQAGRPVITIQMDDPLDLGQEFFRWEIATVTAGAVLGINPLDQPNVQESKDNTNRLLEEFRRSGKLPEPQASLTHGSLRFFSDQQVAGKAASGASAEQLLSWFFDQAQPGDYLALQAYLQETPDTEDALQAIRARLRDVLGVATTLGYGPRYLHSTGQYHKGGPNTGLFLQITASEYDQAQNAPDAPIPGQPYSFAIFKEAQALGDLEALRKHGRRSLRVDLGSNVADGLAALRLLVEEATGGSPERLIKNEAAREEAAARQQVINKERSAEKELDVDRNRVIDDENRVVDDKNRVVDDKNRAGKERPGKAETDKERSRDREQSGGQAGRTGKNGGKQ